MVEARRRGRDVDRGRATTWSRSSRRSAASASTASTRARTSAWRSASSRGSGYLPGRDDAALARRRAGPALHGHARPSPSTRSCPRSRWRRCHPRRRSIAPACSPAGSTGLGAAMNTAQVAAGSTCVVFGAGMVGLGAVAGCRLQGAERIVCVDLSDGAARAGARAGRDRDAGRRAGHGRADARADRRLRAPTTPSRRPGNVAVMRQAVESARMGWGLCDRVRRRRARARCSRSCRAS